jgi:hypothetical protein
MYLCKNIILSIKHTKMITVRIDDKARGSKQLIQRLHSLKFVEFEESKNIFNDIDAEFDVLEKQCITGNELVRRACVHIDELFDAKEQIAL